MRGVAVQEIVLTCFVQLVCVSVLWSAMAVVSTELVLQFAQPSFSLVQEIRIFYKSPQSTAPPPLPTDDVAASISYNYGELYHTCICSWITLCISLIYNLGYLNTQVSIGHANHNCMLFSVALNLSLLPSESYHQYVVNSNLLLKKQLSNNLK